MTGLLLGWLGFNATFFGVAAWIAWRRRNEPVQLDVYEILDLNREAER